MLSKRLDISLKCICIICCLVIAVLLYSTGVRADNMTGGASDTRLLNVDRIVISASVDDDAIDFRALSRDATSRLRGYGDQVALSTLHDIADELTLRIRKDGYLFHTIFVAPQRMRSKTVYFSFLQSRLTDINVINNTGLNADVIEAVFKPFLNNPLFAPAIETKVNLLKSERSINVFAFYSRGKNVGDVRLNLRVDPSGYSKLSLLAENYGSESVGRYRFIPTLRASNVITTFDQLTVALLGTAGDGNTLHGFLGYRMPFNKLKNYINLSYGDSSYSVSESFNALGLSGTSNSYGVSLGSVLKKSRATYIESNFAYKRKESEANSSFSDLLQSTQLSDQIRLGYVAQKLGKANAYSISGTLSIGEFDYTSAESSTEGNRFTAAQMQASWQHSMKISHAISIETSASVSAQFTEDNLSDLDEMSIGGAYAVRAIAPGKYAADKAWLASLELEVPFQISAFGITPYFYYDQASGTQFSDLPENNDPALDTQYSLAGTGVGLRVRWRSFELNMSAANAVQEQIAFNAMTENVEDDDRILFEFRWR